MVENLKNLLCIIALILLAHLGYNFYVKQAHSRDIISELKEPVNPTKGQKALLLAKKSSNIVMGTLSKGFLTLGNLAKKARFKSVSSHSEKFAIHDKNLQINILKDQANSAFKYVHQDTMMNAHEKNLFIAKIKEIVSQIEHIEKQVQKGAPTENNSSYGFYRKSAKTVYEQTIERKLLAIVNKLGELLTDLSTEITGQPIQNQTSESITEGIFNNNNLLKTLVS